MQRDKGARMQPHPSTPRNSAFAEAWKMIEQLVGAHAAPFKHNKLSYIIQFQTI